MCRNSEFNDPQSALIADIDNGLRMFNEASREYMTAVRSVDVALEHLAVAFRQLSLGDLPADVRASVDRFGTLINTHHGSPTKAAVEADSSKNAASNDKRIQEYTLVPYINEFSRDVEGVMDDLKTLTRMMRRKREERDRAAMNYQESRIEVDKITKKDVKRNCNSADNPIYAKKLERREVLRKEAEKKAQELHQAVDVLLKRREEVMRRVMTAMSGYTSEYWSNLAQSLQSCNV